MTELQEKELQILLAFDEFCRQKEIKYFLGYGTAIGAVRHKGFIPWDDDIDIIMLREDYEKVCKLQESDFPDGLFWQTIQTDSKYPYPFAKIRDVNTTFIESGYGELDICQGIYIDVFPFDFVSDNRFNRVMQCFLAEYIWGMAAKYRMTRHLSRLITNILNYHVSEREYLRRIKAAEEKMISLGKRGSKVTLFSYGGRAKYARQLFSSSWFEQPVTIEFEGYKFPIQKEIGKILTEMYGDYMKLPPEEQRIAGHEAEIIDCNNSYRQYV